MSDATIQNDDREENSDQVQQNLIRDLDRFLQIQLATMEERLGRLEERSEQGSSHGSRRPRVPLRQNQDDYYSQTEGGSDQGSNFNVRRQAQRNQGPRNRNRNRVDDNLNSIRMAIPPFQGMTDPKAYLEWEKKVELVFECHNYSENNKVKLAAIEFSDYAIIWWDQLTLSRRRNGERPVSTWDEMKALMRKRFVPTHYHRDLFQRLQSLTQGNRSVKDYYKDMEIAMICANVEEDRKATMARFLAGLNCDIVEKVELQNYVEIEDMIHMAIKQILLVYVNHELTNSRSNRTPKLHDRIVKLRNEHLSFPDPGYCAKNKIPGEKSKLDFFLKRLDWIFNLNVKSR
ncbi:hypothetical protein GQ457_01G018050 [Hibiscus cannabinus]